MCSELGRIGGKDNIRDRTDEWERKSREIEAQSLQFLTIWLTFDNYNKWRF